MKPAHILVEGYFTQEEQISQFMLFMLSKHGQMQETGFIEKSPENIQGCEGRFPSFLRVQRAVLTFFHDFLSEWVAGQWIAAASDLILIELGGGHHSLSRNLLVSILIPVKVWRTFPRQVRISLIGHSVCNYSSSPGDRSRNPLEQLSYLSVRLLEMVPTCCFFPYLESPYYTHGSYKTVY